MNIFQAVIALVLASVAAAEAWRNHYYGNGPGSPLGYGHHYGKRSADADDDRYYGYSGHMGYFDNVKITIKWVEGKGKHFGHPRAILNYEQVGYAYRPIGKRSADAEAVPEANDAAVPFSKYYDSGYGHGGYGHGHHGYRFAHHYGKRSAYADAALDVPPYYFGYYGHRYGHAANAAPGYGYYGYGYYD